MRQYNRLHDGPTHLPIGPRTYQHDPPKPRTSLSALQWAADRVGQSYGVFTQHMTVEDEARIQAENEAWQRQTSVNSLSGETT